MHTHTQLHRLHQFWPVLLVALLAIVSPAQGQWYQDGSIDTAGLDLWVVGGNPGPGMSVAINGDTLVVGGGKDAYFFERTPGQWTRTKTLNLLSGSGTFPVQVAIDGDNVAVGSYDSPTSYVLHRDAPGTWSSATLAGSAMDIDISGDTALLCHQTGWPGNYGQRIFDRQADGSWTQSAVLQAPGTTSPTGFGGAGAISGNRVLIGQGGSPNGHAYVYERDATGTWSPTATLDTGFFGGYGKGVALSGPMALIGGWPACMYEMADNGTWTKVPNLSPSMGGIAVADGIDAVFGGYGTYAVRRGAAGVWEAQYLRVAGQDAAVGGGRLAVISPNYQKIQIYSYDSSPRLFYSGFDADTDPADLGFTIHTDSAGHVAVGNGSLNLFRSAEGTVTTVGVSKMLDCQDLVTFTFEYSAPGGGSLQLSLGGVVLDTISSPDATEIPYRRTFNLAELGLSPGQLQWDLDSNTFSTIDNLYITTNVPEPATLALLAAGALAMRRRRR